MDKRKLAHLFEKDPMESININIHMLIKHIYIYIYFKIIKIRILTLLNLITGKYVVGTGKILSIVKMLYILPLNVGVGLVLFEFWSLTSLFSFLLFFKILLS